MGCDGGTIPTRDELVRLKKKPEQKDKDGDRVAKWKHCQISQQPLEPPLVACELGWLYNKTSVIEFLLDKSKFNAGDRFDHIRGLKDIKELKLTENPAAQKGAVDQGSEYICPVTGLEMSGRWRFCYLYHCGCVFSERAMKEVKSDTCHSCGSPTCPSELIVLNGTEEEVATLRTYMEERRAKAKLEKKSKKKRALEAAEGSATANGSSEEGPSTSKQVKFDPSSLKTTGASKLVGSKLTSGAQGGRSATTSRKTGEKDQSSKSIQEDPKASKAYKSLFNTCDKAKNQPKPNWVTYNPCFY